MPDWTPLTDALPPDNMLCWVWDGHMVVLALWRCSPVGGTWQWLGYPADRTYGGPDVTHWQPCPYPYPPMNSTERLILAFKETGWQPQEI